MAKRSRKTSPRKDEEREPQSIVNGPQSLKGTMAKLASLRMELAQSKKFSWEKMAKRAHANRR